MGVAGGGQNRNMSKGFLYLLQINTCFKQMGCEAVAQRMAGDFLFDTKLFDYLRNCCLDTASCNGPIGLIGIFCTVLAAWKDEYLMAVDRPEQPEGVQGSIRQRNQPVFITFAIADDYPLIVGIDVSNLEVDPFAKPESHTVNGKKKTL